MRIQRRRFQRSWLLARLIATVLILSSTAGPTLNAIYFSGTARAVRFDKAIFRRDSPGGLRRSANNNRTIGSIVDGIGPTLSMARAQVFHQPDAEAHPGAFVWPDTCNVYVLRDGEKALLIDLGFVPK